MWVGATQKRYYAREKLGWLKKTITTTIISNHLVGARIWARALQWSRLPLEQID